MNCRRAQVLLPSDDEGLLSPRAVAALAAHLERCPDCARRRAALAALEARVRAAEAWQPAPPAGLGRRVIEGWVADLERAGRINPPCRLAAALLNSRLAFGAAALLLLTLAGIGLARRSQAPGEGQRGREIAALSLPGKGDGGDSGKNSWRESAKRAQARNDIQWNGSGRRGSRPPSSPISRFRSLRAFAQKNFALSPLSRFRAKAGAGPAADDLAALNGDALAVDHRWARLSRDAWEKIEADVRRQVRVSDDFITIPFPRLASTDARLIAAAADEYKKEAAVVDSRLAREVTCAFKATALADLCAQLRGETGIQLSAGPSVADEKVTVFCEKLSLRAVMRQLSRPFGYTWIRSRKEGGEYRYELLQDLKSQLLEEELRNRDRDAALIALDQDMQRYHPYLNLSPDEARERARVAPAADKKLFNTLSGSGWGPIQMYFQLSPAQQAALRSGEELKFKQEPGTSELPLSPDIARGVLQSQRDLHMVRETDAKGETHFRGARADEADGLPPSAISEARAGVTLKLDQTELGRFGFSGSSEVSVQGSTNGEDNGPYAVGQSPSSQQPENGAVNAALARDPALQAKVTLSDFGSPAKSKGDRASVPLTLSDQSKNQTPHPEGTRHPKSKITTADFLEALHRASGMPIVADFYTRLYAPETVSIKDQPLFAALNHLADALRLRWNKEDGWLQFRSSSFYNDRPKEVPNRLLARWAAARREHGSLSLDDLIEIAGLTDTQLDARDMGEGAKELWGLEEWGLAGNRALRPHLRWMAGFTPAERQKVQHAPGLGFTELTLAQQQQFIALAIGDSTGALDSLQELATAAVQIDYSLPGQFEWQAPAKPGGGAPEPLAPVRAPTREAALAAARRLDPMADLTQIQPTVTAITLQYFWGTAQANGVFRLHTTGPGDTSIGRSRNKNGP